MGVATDAAPVAVVAPPSKKMAADFVMGGAAAVVAKSGAAPVERVKLLLQNQGELMRRGYLTTPYTGIGECFARVLRGEGVLALWRGNQANVVRYFPTQVGIFLEEDRLFSLNCLSAIRFFFMKMRIRRNNLSGSMCVGCINLSYSEDFLVIKVEIV